MRLTHRLFVWIVILHDALVHLNLWCLAVHLFCCLMVVDVYHIMHHVISWYVSHTTCPPSMSVTHCVIYRGVSVATRLSRGLSHTAQYRGVPLVSVTHRVIYRCVCVTLTQRTRERRWFGPVDDEFTRILPVCLRTASALRLWTENTCIYLFTMKYTFVNLHGSTEEKGSQGTDQCKQYSYAWKR